MTSLVLPGRRSTIERGTIVRPMSPMGLYWADSSVLRNAAYVVTQDLIFTACHFDNRSRSEDFYTEYDEPLPEEIQLLSSLALSIGNDGGILAQYPGAFGLRIEEQNSLDQPGTIERIEQRLRSALSESDGMTQAYLASLRAEYRHFHLELPITVQQSIYGRMRPSDHLLIRGLSTFLKATMLSMHQVFGEEANYPLWISLDASFEIIREVLRKSGNPSPSAIDAQNFIHDAFSEEYSGFKYFEEFYEDRVMTMHPRSRFGTFQFAPIGRNDFYSLYNALREVYRFLILGKVVNPNGIAHA